ncbi:hypothetical protein [Mycolicibacterium sediminis]|uniref:PPE family protein n=1 Tax=Mycolicibacterium sediminis TaxID=1286180 RepID=A0A7I7QIF1_9MYCO|nr:hypothetical protein [Mycolicibacterium sediminis]BBY26109.1 hypothetical protein MSEDJ_02050 [Mycolicibacterium sediminis]
MGLQADVSPYGSQTVMGPGWPNVDEEALASAAGQYEALAAKLLGSVVPLQQSQLMALSDKWTGGGAVAAAGEATSIIGAHEAHAAQAASIALRLRSMEVTVARTKALVNATAMETQRECEAIQAMPVSNTSELIQSRMKMGLAQNMAYVNANTTELASSLGVPPSLPGAGSPGGPAQAAQEAGKAGGKGSEQGMQMMMQMASMAAQIPQQLGGMVMQAPQQLMQQVQQLAQPLQQLTSMFGGKGGAGMGSTPFSSFSNHPLAGGSGAGGGAGMVKAASLPGSGGLGAQTPLMAGLVGTSPEAVAVSTGANTGAVGGVAPVSAGMGGGMGMMPHRGESGGGGSTASLAPPPALDYDLGEDDADDDW